MSTSDEHPRFPGVTSVHPGPTNSPTSSTNPLPPDSFSQPSLSNSQQYIRPRSQDLSIRSHATLNAANLAENIDMGDSLQEILAAPPHDPTTTDLSSRTIRIYFQNVNGLRLQDNATDITDTFLNLQTAQVDIFGLAETKLNCRDQYVQRALHQCRRKVWDDCKIFTSSSDEAWTTTHKPGGTMLGITGPLVGRVKKHYIDDLGRWIRVDLLGRDGRTISIICAYQVVQTSGTHGDNTAYSQQLRLLRLAGTSELCPRKHFIRDLKTLIQSLKLATHDIILMGDFNEEIGAQPDQMASVMNAGNLTDAFTFRHGLDREFPTYARGSRRVDYILLSPRLLEYIRHTGAEPFNFRIFSDHRGLFVDFSMPGFFNRAPNILTKLQTRDLIYDCPRHIRLYLQKSAEYFIQHNIQERLQLLLDSDRDDEKAEALDRDITRGMLAAEATCHSRNRHPWSLALHHAMTKLYLLKRVLSQYRTGYDMSIPISQMQTTLPEPIDIPTDIKSINTALRAAQQERRILIRKSHQRRRDYNQEKIMALQLANPKINPQQIETNFVNTTASKEMYRKVPSARPIKSGGINTIKVPAIPSDDPKHPDTIFRTVVDPTEIEKLILARNQTHFGQARDTPFASPEISQMLGFGGTSSVADLLLSGQANINAITTNKYGQALLRFCKRHQPELTPEITLEEFKSSYKKWRVGTSTSPSGRHLSHQHALLQPHGIDPDLSPDDYAQAETSRIDNWSAQHGIVSYAVKHGYCFSRWNQVVNAMIEKEPGNPQLHRLRVIHLYESDYNSLLGIKLRQVIH